MNPSANDVLMPQEEESSPRRPNTGVTAAPLLAIQRGASEGPPIYRQIYRSLRQAIQSGRLRQGDRLPSTRGLARELGVSRTSILLAFDELRAEGLVVGKVGSGTRIAKLPLLTASRVRLEAGTWNLHGSAEKSTATRAFRIGLPALDLFPSVLWGQLASRRWRAASSSILDYADPAGYLPLRQTLAEYVGRTRGITCGADQVFIVSGSQQGLDLIARVMSAPHDAVWLEDPGYHGVYEAFSSAGATPVPVPVDEHGFNVSEAMRACPHARFAYVTPSNQFPLSGVLSPERRQSLLQWAGQQEGWIIEDDYDCEFRPLRDRLPALASSRQGNRVFYLATFSKTVFPALRLGYLVIPEHLVERFRTARHMIDRQSSTLPQAIMTDFIYEGHYDRHLRRMRRACLKRGEALTAMLKTELGDVLEVSPPAGGLHVVAWLPQHISDAEVSRAAEAQGVEALPLSYFAHRPLTRGALVLGFGGLMEEEIQAAVTRLRIALTAERSMRSA